MKADENHGRLIRFCSCILLLSILLVPIKSHAFCYLDFDVPRSTAIANLVIWVQNPVLNFYRSTWYPGILHRQQNIHGESYSYLIRPGEKEGVLVMVHGVLARKEFFLLLIADLVEQQEPLPTIIVPDLMGHGSQPYPADHVFTLQAFVRHLSAFIRYLKQEYSRQKMIVLGHSLGGGFSLLLKPLAEIDLDGLILFAPAGLPNNGQRDFKWQIEQAEGLPFDFGSSAISSQYAVCFEPPGLIYQAGLQLVGLAYEILASPYESWVKKKMFKDLELSRKQLMTHMAAERVLEMNCRKPLHLFWMSSDRLFSRYRYISLTANYSNSTAAHFYEEEGSHLWIREHSKEAAEKTQKILDQLLNSDCHY